MSSLDAINFFNPVNWADTAPNTDEVGDFEGREVRDLTHAPFWEQHWFANAMVYVAGAGLLAVEAGTTLFVLHSLSADGVDGFYLDDFFVGVVGLALMALTAFFIDEYVQNLTSYADPTYRKEVREKLESGDLDVIDFLNTHGWDNVRKWGLWVPSDQEPMCTKELLADLLLPKMQSTSQFNVLTVYNYYFENYYWYNIDILGPTWYAKTFPHIYYAIAHNIFDKKDVEIFHKKWIANIQENIRNPDHYSASALLMQWDLVKDAGLDRLDASQPHKEMFDWIEGKHQEFMQHYLAYLGAMQDYVFWNWSEDPKLKDEIFDQAHLYLRDLEVPQEILDTLPDLGSAPINWLILMPSGFQTQQFYTDINIWFYRYMHQLDKEFAAKFG